MLPPSEGETDGLSLTDGDSETLGEALKEGDDEGL